MRYQEPNLEILIIGDDVITSSSDVIQEQPTGGNGDGGNLDDLIPNWAE